MGDTPTSETPEEAASLARTPRALRGNSQVRVVLGVLAAVVVLAVLTSLVGLDRVRPALAAADPSVYSLALAAALASLFLFAGVLLVLTRSVEGVARGPTLVGASLTGAFLRGVAPWGQTGRTLLVAYAVDRYSSAPFERTLAAALTAEFCSFVGSMGMAAVGLAYLLTTRAVSAPARDLSIVAVGWSVVVVASAAVLVTRKPLSTRLVLWFAGLLRVTLGALSSAVARALDPAAIEGRIERFFATIETVGGNRPALGAALVTAHVAWLLVALAFVLSGRAVGVDVPLGVAMVVVPVAGFVHLVPLPGGTGGVELALGGLLAMFTGLDVGTVAAVVVLHRLATYWFQTGVCGLAAVATGALVARAE